MSKYRNKEMHKYNTPWKFAKLNSFNSLHIKNLKEITLAKQSVSTIKA